MRRAQEDHWPASATNVAISIRTLVCAVGVVYASHVFAASHVSITFKSGAVIQLPHLLNGRVGVPIGSGDYQYQLTPPVELRPGKPFRPNPADIVLDVRSSHFVITLNSKPYGRARTWAEALLVKELGISRPRLCDLNANVVGAPGTRYSAVDNLGFSACYGSTVLK